MLSVFSHKESEAVSGSFYSWVMVLISTTLQSNNFKKKIVSTSTAHSNGWKEKNIHLYIYFNNFLSGRRAVIKKKIISVIFIMQYSYDLMNVSSSTIFFEAGGTLILVSPATEWKLSAGGSSENSISWLLCCARPSKNNLPGSLSHHRRWIEMKRSQPIYTTTGMILPDS